MFAPSLGPWRRRLPAALLLAALVGLPVSVGLAQSSPMPNPPPAGPGPNPPPAPTAPVSPAPSPVPAAPIAQPSAPPPAIYPTPVAPPPPAAQPSAAPPVAASEATPQPQAAPVDSPAGLEPEGTSKDDGVQCLIGEFCIGGVLTAGALNVFGIGLHARMEYWGIGLDYQFISLGYERVDGDLGLVTVEGRIYPFGGPFFFCLGLAWQSIALETAVTVDVGNGVPPQRVNAKGNVTMPLFKLGLGFMGRDGFVMGIDLGFGFRLGALDVSLETDLPRIQEVIEAENEFKEAAEAWLEWLPVTAQLNVLRIGYLF